MKFLIFFTLNFILVFCNDRNDENIFIPTKDWKVVKPGQAIPAGLHIRSDFKTGITEAKLLDINEKSVNTNVVLHNSNNPSATKNSKSTKSPEELKKMLKNIKNELKLKENNESIEINGTNYRTYDQLKKDFETLQKYVKTDIEIIRELLTELKGSVSDTRKFTILQDLEYYLHQIDNAQNFVDMGGFSLLHEYLDSGDENIRSESVRCLASALQGNSRVKVKAAQLGTLTRLLSTLASPQQPSFSHRIVIALGAMTRQFPLAQTAFLSAEGLGLFGSVFDKALTTNDARLLLNMATLFSDWIKERKTQQYGDAGEAAQRSSQYAKVDLEARLHREGWCPRLGRLMTLVGQDSIDYYEKVLSVYLSVIPACGSNLRASPNFLDRAARKVESLAEDDGDTSDNSFLEEMRALVRAVKAIHPEHNDL